MLLKTFYIKQWVDEDDFKKLMLFSRYLGRDSNGSRFAIDVERARKNNIKLSDITNILEDFNLKLSKEDEAILKQYLLDCEFAKIGDKIVLKPYIYLAELIKGFNTKYDKINKRFIIRSMDYFDILQKLRDNGLEVKELNLNFKDFEFELSAQLRDYQIESVEAWVKNGKRGVIALPTGAGKTLIGIKAIEEVKKSTLIITYTKEQMLQWRDSIIKFSSKRPEIGLYYSE
ncbi:MAG: DEAD/DEAH box helicase family protein, partial [Saccharolobus sp.]